MRTFGPLLRSWLTKFQTSKRMKYAFLFLLSSSVIVAIFFLPGIASADLGIDDIQSGIMIWAAKALMGIASLFIQLAIFFLKFFILIAGYNGYIEADVVKFGWNIVRDVANMFFIIILLVIAFGTILGLEQYEWKKALPKLIFAAIFVNFSNVICQLFIDVAQVFTVTFLNAVAGTAGGNLINIMDLTSVLSFIANNKSVTAASGGSTDIPLQLFIASFFSVFFTAIAAGTIGSYLIVMIYRMVTLWCLIIISPLAFIFSILPSTKGYADEFWKEFINHVISAPVMVFFLWLAFATFGGGNIVETNLQRDNSIKGIKEFSADADAVGQQSSITIGQASSWNNFANFVVAIGFLMIGVERVQKLGVRGGDYVQRGFDMAKNVAMIATGVRFGQRRVDNVKSAVGATLGFAARKLPVLGGDAWKRRGTAIAGRARLLGNKINIARDNIGQGVEKKNRALGMGFNLITLGAFKSGKRADMIAENWKKAADSAKERHEEEISTSYTSSGKAKLTEGVKLEIAKEQSAAGKDFKFAQERNRLIGKGGKFAELVNTVATTRAKGESLKKDLNRDQDIRTASARAGVLRAEGKNVEAMAIVQSTFARQHEEDNKELATLSQSQRANLAESIADEIGSVTDVAKRQLMQEQASRLVQIAAANGTEEYERVMKSLLKTVYAGKDIDFTSENAGTLALEAISQKKINSSGDFKTAQQNFDTQTFRSPEHAEAAKSAMLASFGKLAMDGGVVEGAGAIIEKKGVDATGRYNGTTVRSFANQFDADDMKLKQANEKWFAPRVPIKNMADSTGFYNRSAKIDPVTGERETKVVGISAEQQERMIERFSGLDERAVTTEINNTFEAGNNPANFEAAAKSDMVDVLNQLHERYDKAGKLDAFDALLNKGFRRVVEDIKTSGITGTTTGAARF